MQLLAKLATAEELAVATETLDALQAVADLGGQAWGLFNDQSQGSDRANFQIACVAEKDIAPHVLLGAFYCTASEWAEKYLWFDFRASDIQLWCSTQEMALNEEFYSNVRQLVAQKLGDKAKTLVANLDI